MEYSLGEKQVKSEQGWQLIIFYQSFLKHFLKCTMLFKVLTVEKSF